MTKNKRIGEILRKRRNDLGWSLAECHKRFGTQPGTISRIERGGKGGGYFDTVMEIAAGLGIRTIDVVKQTRDK